MSLEKELNFKKAFSELPHEALLNIYYTANLLKKKSADFFRTRGITDVQFNVLELLYHQAGERKGLTQVELSRMLLVNRANITSLIDRMEKAGFVSRQDVPGDRRYNIVRLTDHGKKLLLNIEKDYIGEVKRIMKPLNQSDMKSLIRLLERIREKLKIE